MNNPKAFRRINLFLLIFTIGINIAAYRFLPEQVAMQISLSGGKANHFPKFIFVLFVPVILSINYYLTNSGKEVNYKSVMVAVIAFIINLVFIYINL